MEIIRFPQKEAWKQMLQRPVLRFDEIKARVQPVLQAVADEGDAAVKRFTQQFDRVALENLQVTSAEIERAAKDVDIELQRAIQLAYRNIWTFHESQIEPVKKVETAEGVVCWRKSVPIERVGLYIPGGTSPLFSTVLMLGIPAKIAGCAKIVLCSPPRQDGSLDPAILYTANLIGMTDIYKIGGAQAIAAMAYGTQTVPAVYKIFGPGNQYVTCAKQLVSQEGIAIDMPAGPSEVAVLADNTANPEFIAADLLAQAEHGVDSQAVLVTWHADLIPLVEQAVEQQLKQLPRAEIAQAALRQSKLILVSNCDEAITLTNEYAPEHLIIMTRDAETLGERIVNAGSVFLGAYSPESAGDYASGTNHTLPTNGCAKAFSGVSLESFVKKITYQQLSQSGIRNIGGAIERMADAEGLFGHKNAVTVRLQS